MIPPLRGRRHRITVAFDQQCRLAGLPVPQREWRFHAVRRWRFDWAFIGPERLAVEVEGGAWSGGRHTRGAGFVKDLEKYAEALCLGWRVLRVTPTQIEDGAALTMVDRILRGTVWRVEPAEVGSATKASQAKRARATRRSAAP